MKKLSLVCLVFAAVACGKKTSDSSAKPAAKGAYCDTIKSSSTCREYSAEGVKAVGAESLRSLCTTVVKDATFAEGSCPAAGQVGVCDVKEHVEHYYSTGPMAFTEASAKQACTDGKFSAK